MLETEKSAELRIKSSEAEISRENRENKEDMEAKKNAAMERAEILTKEIKNSRQQMQNILLNIQQVMQVVQQLLKQLDIKSAGDPESVQRDKAFIEKLKKKIQTHREELLKMKGDLIREKARQLAEVAGGTLSSVEIEEKAAKEVEGLINQVLA